MSSIGVFVGLDYHDAGVQVCAMDRAGQMLMNRRCPNNWQVIVEIVRCLVPEFDVHAAIEACTGAADLADELVIRGGWTVDLAHPGYVARMKQGPDKHDWGDSRILADLARVGYLPRVWLAPQEIRELRRLVRYRQQLVHQSTNVKLRIRSILRDHRLRGPGRAWTQQWLDWVEHTQDMPSESRWIMDRHLEEMKRLKSALAVTKKRLEAVTKNDPVVAQLQEHNGIGSVTAWIIRAEIGRFDRFRTGKQLSKFCGLSPRNNSTDSQPKTSGLIGSGNRELRAVLIQAAHRLARHDKRWHAFAVALKANGKPGSVVAAAVANRWIRWLFHQMQPNAQAA